jgi:branched-chain amino acid transport system ATP-binding protein
MPQNKNETVIRIANLSLRFGGLQALDDIDLEVREGEILAIIGPNGAGKTCVLNCVNGFYHPYQGKIFYQGIDLTGLKPHKIAVQGIARTFQNIELYSGLSALDNLMAARHIHMRHGALLGCMFFGPTRGEEIAHRQQVEEIIDLLEMESIRKKVVC